MSEGTAPTRVGIFVFDEVEVLDCCGPFEVFSVANRVSSLRNGTPPFVVSLIAAIESYVAAHNDEPEPLVWTATAESILEKFALGRVALQAVKQN